MRGKAIQVPLRINFYCWKFLARPRPFPASCPTGEWIVRACLRRVNWSENFLVQALRKFVAKLFYEDNFFLDGKRVEEITSCEASAKKQKCRCSLEQRHR
jgi:hypothetical protein